MFNMNAYAAHETTVEPVPHLQAMMAHKRNAWAGHHVLAMAGYKYSPSGPVSSGTPLAVVVLLDLAGFPA